MEIAEGVHRVSTRTAKPLHLYVLAGAERTLLMDTGMAETPGEVILPFFERQGIDADGPLDIVITHADCDHCGGDREMKRLCPGCRIHVSARDRPLIEDPTRLMSDRYQALEERHGLAYDEETKGWLLAAAGQAQEADSVLLPGQRIRLGEDWEVEVLSLPGHTEGHVMIWDSEHRIAFVGDGVLGHGEYDLNGDLFAPPVYVDLREYLGSIERLEALDPDTILRCHRGPIEREEVRSFLRESREWTQAAGSAVERVLRSRRDFSLAEMVEEIADSGELGEFVMSIDLMYPLAAHLGELERVGDVRSELRGGVAHYYQA